MDFLLDWRLVAMPDAGAPDTDWTAADSDSVGVWPSDPERRNRTRRWAWQELVAPPPSKVVAFDWRPLLPRPRPPADWRWPGIRRWVGATAAATFPAERRWGGEPVGAAAVPPIADTDVAATSPCTAIVQTSASAGGLSPTAPLMRHLPPEESIGTSADRERIAREQYACAGRRRTHPWDPWKCCTKIIKWLKCLKGIFRIWLNCSNEFFWIRASNQSKQWQSLLFKSHCHSIKFRLGKFELDLRKPGVSEPDEQLVAAATSAGAIT